ncbi:MAG: DUF1512 family protein [Candidatus Hydrothermarchaeaceae archaeon]
MFPIAQAWFGQIAGMIMFFVFIAIYPKYMLYKMIGEMEEVAETLEGYTEDAIELIVKVAKEKGGDFENTKEVVTNVMDFFLIPPVSLDPYGILKKVEHIIDKTEERLVNVAGQISPESDRVWKANTVSLLKGGIGINNIAKMVRHYVEFVKKTNNLQIAMLMQMNMPLIKKIAKAQKKGVEAIGEGKPIGDGIAPLIVANMIEGDVKEAAREVVYSKVEMNGRTAFVLKADGPGATLGKLGDAVKKIAKEQGAAKIITVDASLKLEGEKTGKVSEGIGAAIGDPGPEKAKMEETATEMDIPLEAFVIKMSLEEAISPLTENIGDSVSKAISLIKESIERTREGSTVVIIGVGNTCGIGNTRDAVKDIKLPEAEEEKEKISAFDKFIKTLAKKPKKAKKEEKN